MPKVRQAGYLTHQVGYVVEVFSTFSYYVGSCWRVLAMILAHLGALGPDFVARLPQENAKIALPSPTYRQRGSRQLQDGPT